MSKTLFREAVFDREHRSAVTAAQESAEMDEEIKKQSVLLQRTNEDVNALNMQFRRLDQQLASWTRNLAREPKAGGGALMRLLAVVGAFLLGAIVGPGILKTQFPPAQPQAFAVDPEETVPWQTPVRTAAQTQLPAAATTEEAEETTDSAVPVTTADEPKPAVLPDRASEPAVESASRVNAASIPEPAQAEAPQEAPQDSPRQATADKSAPTPIEVDEPLAPELFVGIRKKEAASEPIREQQPPRGQQVQSVNGRIGI